jgi:hypothetical protein
MDAIAQSEQVKQVLQGRVGATRAEEFSERRKKK